MRDKTGRCIKTVALAAIMLLADVAAADEVLDWNHTLVQAFIALELPPVARINAIVHGAMYDAYMGVDPRYRPFHVKELAPPGTSGRAAVIQAAYTTSVRMLPAQKPRFDAQRARSLEKLDKGPAQTLGLQWGERVANAWLTWRGNDGFTTQRPPFTGGSAPGQWRPTPPWFDPMSFEQAAYMTPLAMTRPSQFRVPPPPPLTSRQYAVDLNEVKTLGGRTSSARTKDQTEAALFWQGAGGVHWNEIAHQVARRNAATLAQNARLFAALNVTMMDAFIFSSEGKRHYAELGHGWRPVTALELAHTDGNPQTEPEKGWVPLLDTPPHPEYPAGHPAFSASAAAVLTAFFGDEQRFSLEAAQLPGKPRSFARFSQADLECGDARIWAGLHLRSTNEATRKGAIALARWVMEHHFQPVQARREAQPRP